MLKIVLIVALVAIAPSEAHFKKLLLKKGIAKHFLPSSLTETLPPVKTILPFFGAGLGSVLGGGGAGGGGGNADVAEAAVGDIADVNTESSENTVGDVADPPQSSEVPVMPLQIPSAPVECTTDKICRFNYAPVYVLYPYYGGYYYPYSSYSYYPYYPYPYPHFYASSEHISTSPATSETSW